jgi:hypothetical protein
MKKHPLIKLAENKYLCYYASVVEWSKEKFEIAVVEEDKRTGKTDLDYSYSDDVMTVESPMQVYGKIQYELIPHYYMEW